MKTKVAVIRFPGSNCDHDTVLALERIGAEPVTLLHHADNLQGLRYVVLPGGFSYGDYLRAGALAAHAPIMDALQEAVERDQVRVLGICNGFQILCERGILPGALHANVSGEFRCRMEWIEVVSTPAVWPGFTPGMRFRLPIAHADGAYRIAEVERKTLWESHSVFLRYRDPVNDGQDYSPNGSVDAIAGISQGSVMALMPHPERAMEQWMGSDDGRRFLSLWLEVNR